MYLTKLLHTTFPDLYTVYYKVNVGCCGKYFLFGIDRRMLLKSVLICLVLVMCGMSSAMANGSDLVVASFNLRMNTPRDGQNAWPHRKEMVKNLIRYHEFDLIGTQEGFRGQLDDILELTEFAATGSGRDDGKQAGEHSAILYRKDRFKLIASGDLWLSETPNMPGKGWDAKCCNRIVSWAKLHDVKAKKTFYIFNAHFDHEGVVARRESGKLVVAKIKEIAKSEPVILTGDLNSTPETEQVLLIKEHLRDAFDISTTPVYGPVGTFNAFKIDAAPQNRIDYIFVSKHFQVSKYAALTDSLNGRFPSDHFPVVAQIKFSKSN